MQTQTIIKHVLASFIIVLSLVTFTPKAHAGWASWGTFDTVAKLYNQIFNTAPAGSTTTYAGGSYALSAPASGIYTYRAQNADGNAGSYTHYYDPYAPALSSWQTRDLGGTQKAVDLQFNEENLSGVSQVAVTIKDPGGGTKNYLFTGGMVSGDKVSVLHDFSTHGSYLVSYTATDNATNVGSGFVKLQINQSQTNANTFTVGTGIAIANRDATLCSDQNIDDGEQCDDGNTANGDGCSSTCQFEFGDIQIIGARQSSLGITDREGNTGGQQPLGDLSRNEAKTAIQKNISGFISRPDSLLRACTNTSTITSSNWDSFACSFQDGKLLYFRNTSVYLDDPSGTLALSGDQRTILIHGGNLYINSNVVYAPGQQSSFGILVIKNDNGDTNPLNDGGNVYISPRVTNIATSIYTEGPIASLDSAGNLILQHTISNINEIRSQLYWQGSIISMNTIGGSDRLPPECPVEMEEACLIFMNGNGASYRAFTRLFDLNYVRTFFPGFGGTRAGRNADGSDNPLLPDPPDGIANNHTVIIKYDSRVKSNPPPLFQSAGSLQNAELGY